MKDGSKTACAMGTVEPYLVKERFTRANLKMIQCMGSECFIGPMVEYMKAIGSTTKRMAKVSIFGLTVKYMKENLRTIIVKALGLSFIQTAKSSKVIGVREKSMVLATIFSRTAAFTL